MRFKALKRDTPADIHRQNVQKARAMTRMAIYDGLTKQARDVFKEKGFPRQIEPNEDQVCNHVASRGAYFDHEMRMRIPGE